MSGTYLGEVRIYGFNFAPVGGTFCNGAMLSISQNTALFALIGTFYGGNGQTTFAVPNLNGRAPIGMGQLPGGSYYNIGQAAGSESVTLLQSNLPPHVHTFTGSLNAIATKATDQAPASGSQLARGVDANGTDSPQIYVPSGTSGTSVPLSGVSGTTNITGSGIPTSILQPYLAINYCINTSGRFPSRN